MPLIFNRAPYALVLNGMDLAIQPGESIEVSDEEAVSLCESPDWSLNPPAQAKRAKSQEPSETASPTPSTPEPANPGEQKE